MKTLAIALLYLKQTFRSRAVLLLSLLMPLAFTAVLGIAMQGMAPDEGPRTWTLLVADEDQSALSALLIAQLETDGSLQVETVPAADLSALVEEGQAAAGLHIPHGFAAAVQNGDRAPLQLYRSAQEVLDAQVLAAAVQTALSAVDAMLNAQAVADQALTSLGLPAPAGEVSAAARTWNKGRRLEVQAAALTRLEETQIPIGVTHSSPGMLVMFALFMTLGGGASLLMERERGTLRRLLVMPVRKSALLGGKLLGIYLSVLAQMLLMVLFGRYALDVNWGRDALALTVMLLVYGFTATALGMMLAALVRTAAQLDGLSTILVMALSALGGAWWPIEIVPPGMQTLARALPTYWGMQGFQDIIIRGLGLREILPEAAVLLAFGLAFLSIGLWRFRWE